jgi:serine/threonine protein kinase
MFPQIFGKYVLEREIAAGGMARVLLGTLRGAVGFEKRVVVKQIRPELASDEAFVKRFVEEAKTAVELSHPNIVPVYELGVEQGVYYIAMEYCAGATLAEIVAETGPLSPEEGAYVGVEICRALDYAHRRAGIVHRDVTPRNALIDEEGAVRLIDFGIAAPATGGPGGIRQEVFGSPGHMPPEQLEGRELSPATDVFAVAVLLIEAWTGRPPFRRASLAESERALKRAVERIDAHDARLSEIADLVASAIALDVAARPSSAELFARPLREFLKSVDAGDVARRLGERAANVLRRAQVPATTALASAQPDPKASGVTHTFAARQELSIWSKQLSDARTAESAETPSSEEPTGVGLSKDASGLELPATRRLEPIELGNEVEEQENNSRLSELPVSGAAQDTRSKRRRERNSGAERAAGRWRLATVALAGMVVAGIITIRFAGRAPVSAVLPSQSAEALSPSPSATPVAIARAAAQPSRPAPSGPHLPNVQSVPAERTEPRSARAAAPAAGSRIPAATSVLPAARSASLSLTAEPAAAEVTIDSRTYGTPVSGVRLPPGSYTVVFYSRVLDEKAMASIALESGQSRSVHADFTQARPRVIVR